MFEEFRGHVFVNRVGLCEFQRHGKHREAIESHPGGSVRLLEESASWQRLRTIEYADVIEPEETAREKIELLLREVRIDFRKWNHVESEVPCREPGIFPFVRHRDDVAVEKMTPFAVAAEVSFRRRWWLRGIDSEPVANDVIVKLLAPKQSGVSLARNLHRFFIDSGWRNRVVKFVRLFHALGKGIAWHFTFR